MLENRLIKALKPPGNTAQEDARRLRLPALPARHPVPDPRGRAASRRPATPSHRPAPRPRRRRRARRAAQHPVRAPPLRARAHAPAAPVGVRADGALPLAVPRRPRPEPLPRAARRGAAAVQGRRRAALLAHVDAQMRAASAGSASSAPPGCGAAARGCESLLERLGGVLRAPTRAAAGARPAPDRARPRRRVLDRRRPRRRLGRRSRRRRGARGAHGRRAARRAAAGLGGWLPADELDELRIIGSWLAGHEDVRVLELEPRPDQRALAAFTASPTADRPRTARRAAPSARARVPVPGS